MPAFSNVCILKAFWLDYASMFDDDDTPRNMPKQLKNLEPLSVEDLQDYIRDLQVEVQRAETELKKKKDYSANLDSFFKD